MIQAEPQSIFLQICEAQDRRRHASSFLVSLDHLNQILDAPEAKARRGEFVSVTKPGWNLSREADMLGLIRSGYIGTHKAETEALATIIQEAAKGTKPWCWRGSRRFRRRRNEQTDSACRFHQERTAQEVTRSGPAAVQIFNNPNISFKSNPLCVMIIAWTYLLHAYFRDQKIGIDIASRTANGVNSIKPSMVHINTGSLNAV